MPRRTANKAPSAFHTVCSQTHGHRTQKSLQEAFGKELGAPCTCQLIPKTRQKVLTPEKQITSLGPATETDHMGQDHLRGMVLLVPAPIARGGRIPHGEASNRPVVYGTLRQLPQPAAAAIKALSRERHHHLRCSVPLNLAGGALVQVPPHTSRRCTLDPPPPPGTKGFP